MKNYISKDAYVKNDSGLAITLSNEIKELKKKGLNILDATVGMYFNEDCELDVNPLIYKELNKCINTNSLRYASINGGKEYNNNAIKWVLKNQYSSLTKKYFISSNATMGGTGALFIAFRNYIDNNGTLLIPNIGWGNYKAMLTEQNKKFVNYNLFNKENKLDITDIKNKINEIAKKENKVTILINDPCHNPTSYCISEEEWKKLIKLFNDVNKKCPLTLILDIAYADFSSKQGIYYKLINETKVNYLTLLCFSSSKSFSFYGLRLGALICITNSKEENDLFISSSEAVSRASWSNPNAITINTFNEINKSKENIKQMNDYYKVARSLLKKRLVFARKIFDPIFKVEPFPYIDGFFLTYPVNDANKVAEELKKKNIYVLPMANKYIRVAICSMSIKKYKSFLK